MKKAIVWGLMLGLATNAMAQKAPKAEKATKATKAAPSEMSAKAKEGAMPGPATELKEIGAYDGSWRCTGKFMGMPGVAPGDINATYKQKATLNGFYLGFEYTEKKRKGAPAAYACKGFIGYDAKSKVYTRAVVDAMGGAQHDKAAGWKGDTLTWEGSAMMMGQKMSTRETWTRDGKKKMSVKVEFKGPQGWAPVNDMVCKR